MHWYDWSTHVSCIGEMDYWCLQQANRFPDCLFISEPFIMYLTNAPVSKYWLEHQETRSSSAIQLSKMQYEHPCITSSQKQKVVNSGGSKGDRGEPWPPQLQRNFVRVCIYNLLNLFQFFIMAPSKLISNI